MVLFVLSILLPTVYASETAYIRINEFVVEPTQKVEIINNHSSSVDISGWYIDDDGGSTYITIPNGTIVSGNSCVVITGNFNLNKSSADRVRLFDKNSLPTDTISVPVDEYLYTKSPGENMSFGRNPDGFGAWEIQNENIGKWNANNENCLTIPSPIVTHMMTPTPVPTMTLTVTQTPSVPYNIYISEVMVAPHSGEPEWIELYNDHDQTIVLTNWYIDDIENGGSNPHKFSLTIPPKGYAVYELSTAIFNNNEDIVRLLNSNEEPIDLVEYFESKSGISMGWKALKSQEFCFQNPSKGLANGVCINESTSPDRANLITPKHVIRPTLSITMPASLQQNVHLKKYQINIPYLPITPTIEVVNQEQIRSDVPEQKRRISFLVPAYSLLSIISLTAKIKLSQLFS